MIVPPSHDWPKAPSTFSGEFALARSSSIKTNPLNQPLHLPNGSALRNRLAKSSMSETLGTYDNHATPKLVELYRRWAASGLGLLLSGNVMIDRARAVRPLEAGAADLIALPARSLPNPDLVPRMRADATLNAAIATDLKSECGSTGRLHRRM